MKLKAYCVSLVFVATAILCCHGVSTASPEDQVKSSKPTGVFRVTPPPPLPCVEFPVEKRGLESEGFTLKAELPLPYVVAGSAVTVKLTLTCTAGKDRNIWHIRPTADYVLLVEDARNIEYRVQCRPIDIDGRATRNLSAGEVAAQDYDASSVFDFQREGTYRITLGRIVPKLRGSGYGVVLSNTVELKVTGTPGTR